MPQTVSTRFLVISDTHSYKFDDAKKFGGSFVRPVPKCDVLLHCGDLTGVGGVEEYKKVLQMLKEIPAELKLVIAGNHDLDLDREWWANPADWWSSRVKNQDMSQHEQALEVMTGALAQEAGVTYLTEGLKTFTLKNGAHFTVYASQWQPEFCNWAFNYPRNKDRYNTIQHVAPGVTSIAEHPIPDFGKVDIVMTHGPPQGILDWTPNGEAGCENILRAVSRARPRLHCFGHIHEAHGAQLASWKPDMRLLGKEAIQEEKAEKNTYPEPQKISIDHGKETLFLNAAIMDYGYKPRNPPWLVDLDLPRVSDKLLKLKERY
jgi:Icc-related predicted phosphoesterase